MRKICFTKCKNYKNLKSLKCHIFDIKNNVSSNCDKCGTEEEYRRVSENIE